jgi:hypothetical protein
VVAQLTSKRILIDGAILTAIAAPMLVLTLYTNPRIALSDYPEDVQAAVPVRIKKELRQGMGMPGYKDWRMHVRGHTTTGLPILAVVAALLTLAPTFLYWRERSYVPDEQ